MAHALSQPNIQGTVVDDDETDLTQMVDRDKRIEEIIRKERNRDKELDSQLQEALERVKAE